MTYTLTTDEFGLKVMQMDLKYLITMYSDWVLEEMGKVAIGESDGTRQLALMKCQGKLELVLMQIEDHLKSIEES